MQDADLSYVLAERRVSELRQAKLAAKSFVLAALSSVLDDSRAEVRAFANKDLELDAGARAVPQPEPCKVSRLSGNPAGQNPRGAERLKGARQFVH